MHRFYMTYSRHAVVLLCLGLVVSIAAYWPGLSGPFLFDDFTFITAVNKWAAGEQGLAMTVLPNPGSVVFSRPVAMGSFAVSAWLGAGDPFAYKLGNLIIHLLCGVLIFVVMRRAFAEDRALASFAWPLAAFLSVVWLLHPLHVSTVLYVVQRMAQLGALFTLLAVACYLVGRRRLIAGQTRSAAWLLFAAFPCALAVGLLSKQNAAIAPFLCLALEMAYFSRERLHRPMVLAFFAVFALVPLLAVASLLVFSPQSLLAAYGDWGFTLEERLLTQPRAVLDYARLTLLPDGPRMGIYTDDFPISTGFLSPPQTLLAFVMLAAVTGLAVAVRNRAPTVLAGWGLFLFGHGVESTFLPLEMYYEHRNYLPSVGLLMAFPGLLVLLPDRLNAVRLRRIVILGGGGLLAVLAFATFGRALVWQSEEGIVTQAVIQRPRSMRASLDMGKIHITRQEYDSAIAATAPLRQSDDRRQRVIGHLQRQAVQCMRGGEVDTTDMRAAAAEALPEVTVFELQMARLLVLATPSGECGNRSTRFLAEGLQEIVDAAHAQLNPGSPHDATRMTVAQLYARAGDWQQAQRQAELAWNNRTHLPAGALLVRIYVHNLEREKALFVIRELESRARSFDTISQDQIRSLRALVDERLGGKAAHVCRQVDKGWQFTGAESHERNLDKQPCRHYRNRATTRA